MNEYAKADYREKFKNGYKCLLAGGHTNTHMTKCKYYKNTGSCFCAYQGIDFQDTWEHTCNYRTEQERE